MKNFLFIIALFFFTNNYGQIKLSTIQGYWINDKVEMKDGSDLFGRFIEDSVYAEYRIDQNKLCINSSPIHRTNESCLDFTLINNLIKTSQYAGFIIEKVSNDSLILSEKIDGLTDDKLKRLYFRKQEVEQLAGHKWPGTTEKYIKVNSLEQRELINRYFPSI